MTARAPQTTHLPFERRSARRATSRALWRFRQPLQRCAPLLAFAEQSLQRPGYQPEPTIEECLHFNGAAFNDSMDPGRRSARGVDHPHAVQGKHGIVTDEGAFFRLRLSQ
jgi:hypothetical protein